MDPLELQGGTREGNWRVTRLPYDRSRRRITRLLQDQSIDLKTGMKEAQ